MKKIIVTLAVLLLAAPAMATVTITCTASDTNEVTVSFASDEGQLVRAIALDIQVNDPNVYIVDVNCVSAGYQIHPGSISIDAGGTVTDYGTCAGSIDGNDLTSEQGSLYEAGVDPPPVPGDLFIITLGGCAIGATTADVSVSENALRGGIVMEDAGAPAAVSLVGCTVTVNECPAGGCQTCLGDLSGDGWVMVPDLFMMIGKLGTAGAPFTIPSTDPLYQDCADMNGDNWIMVPDYFMLLGMLGTAGAPFTIPCP